MCDWDFMALTAWCFSHELFKWITLGFLAPSSHCSMGLGTVRTEIEHSLEHGFKTWWSQRADSCQHWCITISAGPRSSPLDGLLSLWVRREHSCEGGKHVSHGLEGCGSCSFPSLQPNQDLCSSKYFEFYFGRTKVFECNAPPQFLRWYTPFFH